MTRVPYYDPWAAGLRSCWGDILRAWKGVLERGRFLAGPEIEAFETEWAARVGAPACAAVASGTAALQLALRAVGCRPGDAVAVPAFGCPATIAAVLQAGCRPLLLDVDARTGLLTRASLAPLYDPPEMPWIPRAIIPVHLFGRAAPVAEIAESARMLGAAVIEDAAQAHGLPGVGRDSAAVAWSFYPTKNLPACGDAGAVTSRDPEVVAEVRRLRHYGADAGWHVARWGPVARMDELQAAALRIRLRRFGEDQRRRAQVAAEYRMRLPKILEAGWDAPGSQHIFPVRVPDRDAFRAALRAHGIETGVHYPLAGGELPETMQPWLCPEAAAWAREEVSLPCYPGLRDAQVDAVVRACAAYVDSHLTGAGAVR